MTPRPTRAVGAALLILLASACGGSSTPKAASGTTPSAATTPSAGSGTFDATGMTSVNVTATDFVFTPSTIIGTPGQKLQLVVHNTTGTPHNISQTAQHLNTDLDPRTTHTVTLTVPASGRLVFFCEYHQARGMTGSLGPAGSTALSSTASSSSTTGSSGGYAPYSGGG